MIHASRDLTQQARRLLKRYRRELEDYIRFDPRFAHSLQPLPLPEIIPSKLVEEMLLVSDRAGVGPMAAVAGAIAQFVGRGLRRLSQEVIIENGGDIYIDSHREHTIGLYAGKRAGHRFHLGLKIDPRETPLGICTSSGIDGHSLSLGRADAVVVLADSAAYADAAATRLANSIQKPDDIPRVLKIGRNLHDIRGILIVIEDQLALWGSVQLVEIPQNTG